MYEVPLFVNKVATGIVHFEAVSNVNVNDWILVVAEQLNTPLLSVQVIPAVFKAS